MTFTNQSTFFMIFTNDVLESYRKHIKSKCIYNTSRKTIPISPLDVHCFLFSEITLVLLMFLLMMYSFCMHLFLVVRYQNTPNATFKSTSNYIYSYKHYLKSFFFQQLIKLEKIRCFHNIYLFPPVA